MASKTARQKIQVLFWLITVVGVLGILFTLTVLFTLASLKANIIAVGIAFTLVYMIQVASTFGLALHWFTHWIIRSGKIINMIQWISGVTGAAAIFDLARRFLGKNSLEISTDIALASDSIAILLFILWMFVSHFIRQDVKERKVCEFC